MDFGLVHFSYSLPEGQCLKIVFLCTVNKMEN